MITVVCWAWGGLAREYKPEHVNILAAQFARRLTVPHQVVCITDYEDGFSPAVRVVPTPPAAKALAGLRSLEGRGFPSCMRRLWVFSREAAALGDRLLCIDVDTILPGNIDHLVDRDEDFVGYRPANAWPTNERFGGGLCLLRAGSRPHVWESFNGIDSMKEAQAAGYRGSDQAWISHCLWGREAYWGEGSGIYNAHTLRREGRLEALPQDACLVHFNGSKKPWQVRNKWVRDNWRVA